MSSQYANQAIEELERALKDHNSIMQKQQRVMEEQQVDFAGGKVASSKISPIHLIPTLCIEKTAERFQLGIERKGNKSWNAISDNQEVLANVDFAIERTSHIIEHALKLRDKLDAYRRIEQYNKQLTKCNPQELTAVFDSDDDASAIVWGGMFLQCVVEALQKQGMTEERVKVSRWSE